MARNDFFSFLRQDLEPECKSLTAACKEHLVLWVKRFQELRKNHTATLKASHLSTTRIRSITVLSEQNTSGVTKLGADWNVASAKRTETNVNVSVMTQLQTSRIRQAWW